jgi:integrase
VIVLLDTGARYSEAAGLSWTNVDLKNKTIALYRSKVKNESTLHMTSRVHEVLTRRFKNKTANQKFIFESVEGSARKYSPGAFVRACKRCGIEGITLHSLRHYVLFLTMSSIFTWCGKQSQLASAWQT